MKNNFSVDLMRIDVRIVENKQIMTWGLIAFKLMLKLPFSTEIFDLL